MAKYDVELITDKHGKPMPQYYDEQEGVMKPITHDNFNGQIVGDVNAVVEFPDVQKVEVTNAQTQMDVNVINPVDNVSVDNLPTDYPDSAVKAELELIKQQQAEILDKLNDTIDTRLTGSIDEYALPVREIGRAVEVIRNYSHTVTNAGNHSAGDVFRRGNDVPALDVSNYKNIIISIINTGVGSTNLARLITYTSHGNISGDGKGTITEISRTDIPQIPEGGKLVITGVEGLKDVDGFMYAPVLNAPIVELVIGLIISRLDSGAIIQIIGESRQKGVDD